MKNLYNAKEVFRLIIGGVETVINEPVGWDSVSMNLSRDMDLYGVNSEFVKSDTVSLKFPFGQGYELLKNLYKTYGSDAYAEFSFSYLTKEGIESQEFLGTIDFNSFGDDGTYIYANIEKQAFNSLLRTRFDTKVSLNAKETLDGEVFEVSDLYGTARNLQGTPFAFEKIIEGTIDPSVYDTLEFYLNPEITEVLKSDITTFNTSPMAILPIREQPQFTVTRAGFYTFNFSLSGTFRFEIVASTGEYISGARMYIKPLIEVWRGGVKVADASIGTETIINTTNMMAHNLSFDGGIGFNYEVGDLIYFPLYIFTDREIDAFFRTVRVENGQNEFTFFKQADANDYPFRGFELQLHSKEIVKFSEAKTPSNQPDSYDSTDLSFSDNWCYLQLDSETILTNQVAGFTSAPLGIITEVPVYTDQYTFKAEEAGTFQFEFDFSGDFDVTAVSGIVSIIYPALKFVPFYAIKTAGGGVSVYEFPSFAVDVLPTDGQPIKLRNLKYSSQVDLGIDDMIFIGAKIYLSQNSSWIFTKCDISNSFSNIKVSQATIAPPSTCRAYNLFDTIKFVTNVITNTTSTRVISSILDTPGCLNKYCITNGFQIRNFEISERPVQISMADLAEICKIWNLGIGIKTDGFGTDYIIIEPMETFFSGDEITTLTNLYDYKEEHEKDLVFNEINIGYDKFATDDDNYLDDIHTEQSILLPIKTHKNKKEVKVSAIASGYLIEQQRREQFADTPSKSVANDDDIFVINYVENFREYRGIVFETGVDGIDDTIRFDRSLGFSPGDKFLIDGGVYGNNDGTLFTVVSKDPFQDLYTVTPTPIGDLGNCTVIVPISGIQAVRNENYQTTNILNPESCYNLAITPKQMLFWWKDYFNIGLTQKAKSEVIKTTFVKQNTKATITPLSTSNCEVLPSTGISMMGDISIETYGYLQRSFMPSLARFKCPMTYETYLLIKQAVRGELSANSSNFGYIVFEDYDNVQWQAHLKTLEYNPSSQIATIEAYKIGLN